MEISELTSAAVEAVQHRESAGKAVASVTVGTTGDASEPALDGLGTDEPEALRCVKRAAITTQAGNDGRGWTLARLDLMADRHRCSPRATNAGGSLDEIQDCTCVEFCDEDPKTACSLSGRRHVHPAGQGAGFGLCPVHLDAPGDVPIRSRQPAREGL
ncbi:hypothetical protein AB0P17_23125 [Streptomyces sp. NPDC088124]|uniref:hypothetical protein n=1 Tax=Streptomyces sp. NPDC088124 TaxID=3154654 RepID=UPI00343ED3CA